MTAPHTYTGYPASIDLHDTRLEKDSCGTGFVVNIKREPSFMVTQKAIEMLIAMDHRGGRNADPETGDGVGISFSIPHTFFETELAKMNITLPPLGNYGVGNIFLPQDSEAREHAIATIESISKEEGLKVLAKRELQVDSSKIGIEARNCEPHIIQIFLVEDSDSDSKFILEKRLYITRKRISNYFHTNVLKEKVYVCSLSHTLVVYKGMLTPQQLPLYYDDLQQDTFETFLGMVHSRFSTNTFPSWERAQPFRMMSHNGEINTVYGNVSKMFAREGIMQSDLFGSKLSDLYPVVEPDNSDSGSFDNTLEFLYQNGYSLPQAICMMIPEAWQHNENMDHKKKSMYEAYSCVMDPWDGPACITFTDGRYIGVVIDRNGLRPSRYYVMDNDLVIMASEFGVIPVEQARVVKKDRIQPGKVFLIDTDEHRLIDDVEIKSSLYNQQSYEEWITTQKIDLSLLPAPSSSIPYYSDEQLETLSMYFGYSEEDKILLIKRMVERAKEPIGSMGNDVVLACLSEHPRLLYDYFKQWFAQVTNPPIDSIRERDIMSIGSYIGPEGNLLHVEPQHTQRIWIDSPVLSHQEFATLLEYDAWNAQRIDITYTIEEGEQGLRAAIQRIKQEALALANNNTPLIILSDRKTSDTNIAMSSLLALGAVQHYLVAQCARSKCALIVETGEAREIHHFCLLIGYGADAIFPYMALEYAYLLHKKGIIDQSIAYEQVLERYKQSVDYGICKVFAKMGISTIDSYRGAQIFEAVGIGSEIIEECFKGTISRIGGIGYKEIAHEQYLLYKRCNTQKKHNLYASNIISLGNYKWRSEGFTHMWDPESVALLQHAVRYNKKDSFEQYSQRQHEQSHIATLRHLFKFKQGNAIPLEEVESAEHMVTRFVTGAMSYGSISLEAHETLAIAMNRLGGKSNTGEGGEIPERFKPLENGDSKRSAIKQVASGRFGVTIDYLTNASEIQIKMAQGAKPGEGGELPGKKVFGTIASTRYSTPGIELVSPPPHHDIYSIEDLAQLIYDLKNANPQARISVKLVSKAGVGVIAAGVAKTKADHILISGHDGGTGASPLTSIKHAGLPWELGIAEAHQVLVRNNLRSRVVLQTDGQIKTGRDICMAAMLGAEEFGFATSALISLGCIMMRKCEINTCPVGVATQDEALRKKFTGKPEHVMRLMMFLAEETRSIMASLGFRTIDEMVGRTDMLEVDQELLNWKSNTLTLDGLLGTSLGTEYSLNQCCSISQNHNLESVLDQKIIEDTKEAVAQGKVIECSYPLSNINRTTGTMLSHEIAKQYGMKGLPEDTIQLHFTGHAGQSFGAFLAHGVTLKVEGDANDYVGKGLSGGIIVLVSPEKRGFEPEQNIITGNVVLYGAISGKAFFQGRGAERFCIRNSGARVVVEGVGSHGCEYMTGGRVVILGRVESNFASGMSGGIAYVWDDEHSLHKHINTTLVSALEPDVFDFEEIQALVKEHAMRTQSQRAQHILDNWDKESKKFIKVVAPEYQRLLDIQRQSKKHKKQEGTTITGEVA